ncbi:TPA: RHS domain-containing protein, partial [Providencia stuartii]|nr:RHS domain-containing protein [Providencia stuartii]
RQVPIARWYEAQRTGATVSYDDELTLTYDTLGQLVSERNATGEYHHQYDVLGNLTQTQLPNNRAFEYLYYGSGHLQQTNWRDNDQLTVLAEYQRDRLHRETGRTSGLLDNETGYDTRGRITHQVARRMNESVFTTPVLDRRYRWDKRNHLIERSVSYGQGNDLFTSGHWYYNSYQYDPLGQLTQHLGSVQTEHFRYDEAANLFKDRQQSALHNQVHHSDQFDYQYDGFGRMVSRCEKGSTSGQHYHYDAENRIIAVDIHQGPLGYERAEYRYDILGRRIEKRLWKASAIANTLTYPTREPDEVQTFGWVGMVLTHEHSSTKPHTTVYHAYNDHSYTSLARIECTDTPANPRCAIYYTHSGLNGLPEALTNSDGHLVWQGQYGVWGNLQRQARPTGEFNSEQNLRFQGQYFDKETGLHYNTFRYYAPDLGRFTQQDPIGLAGGLNLYQYAPNPLTWIDPWGLSACGVKARAYEQKVQDLYGGKLSQSSREYTAIVDGKSVNGIADHVVNLNGKVTAIEAKYVDSWAKSIRNPESSIGKASFAIKEQQTVLSQAKKYSAAFDEVIYHTNSADFAAHYNTIFKNAGLENITFKVME